MIRCHLANGSLDQAVSQYHQWHSAGEFPDDQLEIVRQYLQDLLRKKGKKSDLPQPALQASSKQTVSTAGEEAEKEEPVEFLDITSIGITFDKGPGNGKMIEFDVNFQSGNMLSLIISSKDEELIANLKTGIKLNNIQYYSPIAIFKGAGIVAARTQIKNGPKKGDFCLDIKIVNQ